MWLASPALPVGGFSYSEGLESAVACGLADTEDSAAAWLLDQLYLGLARSDLPLLAKVLNAWRAGDLARVGELNRWFVQTRESAELRLQTEQMGRSFVSWLHTVRPGLACQVDAFAVAHADAAEPTLCYPVAYALAASASQASARDVLLSFAFGWAENMVQAAIKSVPLGQSAGQRILLQLCDDIPGAVESALALPDSARQSFTPMLAILSAQHETQYSRLFRS